MGKFFVILIFNIFVYYRKFLNIMGIVVLLILVLVLRVFEIGFGMKKFKVMNVDIVYGYNG